MQMGSQKAIQSQLPIGIRLTLKNAGVATNVKKFARPRRSAENAGKRMWSMKKSAQNAELVWNGASIRQYKDWICTPESRNSSHSLYNLFIVGDSSEGKKEFSVAIHLKKAIIRNRWKLKSRRDLKVLAHFQARAGVQAPTRNRLSTTTFLLYNAVRLCTSKVPVLRVKRV